MAAISGLAGKLTSTHEHHREERRRIVDVTVPQGRHTGVSLTLAAYDGPSNGGSHPVTKQAAVAPDGGYQPAAQHR